MPIQTATFTAQMKILQGKRRERRSKRQGGRERETRGRRQERVKGATERRSQRWIKPNRGRAKRDKTGKALFHLSNYIYLSLAHKQTKETNGAD